MTSMYVLLYIKDPCSAKKFALRHGLQLSPVIKAKKSGFIFSCILDRLDQPDWR